MSTSINQNFTTRSLLKFALPSIIMMVFMSCYTIVDGIFVSRFVGSNALSAVNIVYPIEGIVVALATTLATGGNAIISKHLGQGKPKEARAFMTQFILIGLATSLLIAILVLLFLTPICRALGSTEALLSDCQSYLKVLILFAPACVLQIFFQSFFVTAGKPNLGLFLMIGAGLLNGVLDYILIVPLNMGVSGAAIATGIGQLLPAVVGILFFLKPRSDLYFTPFRFHLKVIGEACYNGSSEMVSQLSNSIVTFLFNIILIRLAGASGVAAITILLYGQFLFNAFFMGLSIGVSPVIGFQYGAEQKEHLRNTYKIIMKFTCICSVFMVVLSVLCSGFIVSVFTKDSATFELASVGFRIFAVNFLFSGINIISSGIFTALSNGKVSAIISFSRTLFFLVICLVTFPYFLGITGVWLAVPAAEFLTLILSGWMHWKYFINKENKQYF